MENRGRKRSEIADQKSSEKRPCSSSSSELKPSSSNSPVEISMGAKNSVITEHQNCEVEASSSASVSGRSEGETDKDSSTYGSCDSDEGDDSEKRQKNENDNRSRKYHGEQEKFKRILMNLNDETKGTSDQLASLTELCDVLSFCTDRSITSYTADSLSPVLVRLASNEANPDIMLFAIRAITYLCDVLPRSSAFLVRHDAVHTLCARLMAIDYLDVVEQCLLALEKISADQPLACLQAGTVMAVLKYIDFFTSSVQMVAINTIANMCKELPSDSSAHFMDGVPVLCNLLQYEDQKLVEKVADCLIRITEAVGHSSEMIDEICKHGLISEVIRRIDLNSQTSAGQSFSTRLIGLLSRVAFGSVSAVRTLLELNISRILKNILSKYDISHGAPALVGGDGNSNQVHEILKLLDVLLPPLGGDRGDSLVMSDKEKILKDRPELLQLYGTNILPVLIQMVNAGGNVHVCCGCLSVINKLVYVSGSDILSDMLKNTNVSRFLAGVLARKDPHVLMSALNIVEIVLQKLPGVMLNSLIKEGVIYAIDAILAPERSSHFMLSSSSSSPVSPPPNQKLVAKDADRCLCHNLDISRNLSSGMGACKLQKDSVHMMAKHIKDTYIVTESSNFQMGLTETLQELRSYAAVFTDMVNSSASNKYCAEHESFLFEVLHQIMTELNGSESVSTFEFIESGIVKSLLNYFSNGLLFKGKVGYNGLSDHSQIVLKRFVMFASFSLSLKRLHSGSMPMALLIRKLQTALSSLESFPVILNQISKSRSTYAAIPAGRHTTHPCLTVRLVKEEGETGLPDYSGEISTVEPLTSLDAIGRYLSVKLNSRKDEHQKKSIEKCTTQSEDNPGLLPSAPRSLSSKGEDPSPMEEDSHNTSFNKSQDFQMADDQYLSEVVAALKARQSADATTSGTSSASEELREHGKCPESFSNEDTSGKLIICLDGKQLDQTLTLYQAILQLQVKEENDMIAGRRFWDEVHELTFRKAAESVPLHPEDCISEARISTMHNHHRALHQKVLCFSSMLNDKPLYNLEKSDPVYEILCLLQILDFINKSMFHLTSHDKIKAFAEGENDDWDSLTVANCSVPHAEFVSSKLTEKLEQQMGDPLADSSGMMPSWCGQLIDQCPFLFSFEAKCKYFRLTTFGSPHPSSPSGGNLSPTSDRRSHRGILPKKKFKVDRNNILDSAVEMMDQYAHRKVSLEVEFIEEVGTGLGPLIEFYTLVSHEFQKVGLGMWREDRCFPNLGKDAEPGFVAAPCGLFPRPWSSSMSTSYGNDLSQVLKQFSLLGKITAKALQDGRVLDLPLSKAFYKLILDQELNIYDINSIDPGFARVLLEFQALVDRKNSALVSGKSSFSVSSSCFRNTEIKALCLDFTLPGYPDYSLTSEQDHKMVNMGNLEEYVSSIVDATVTCGVARQVEAFKSGFNQVFPIKSLKIFTEEEIEHLLCGEQDTWTYNELMDHIKFDHGYTASSPPIVYLLELMQEFEREEQQAFVQFVTGAPRLPHGGLAALNPKMTVVRKWSECADGDLPSVMTCANYLKLPSYSCKEIMRERLLYAITEGQGSFHLS